MTALSLAEAEEMVDCLDGFSESEGFFVEATVFDHDMGAVWERIDLFLAAIPRSIDRDSIQVKPDKIDDMDVPCVAVVIRVEG